MEPNTHAEFIRELHHFRDLMGSRKFWDLPFEKRDLAKRGFVLTYLNTFPVSETIAGHFMANMEEYDKREHMVAMMKA